MVNIYYAHFKITLKSEQRNSLPKEKSGSESTKCKKFTVVIERYRINYGTYSYESNSA